MKLRHLLLFYVVCYSVSISAQSKNKLPRTSGNPTFPGWYASPEGVVFGDEYWIYPTYSTACDDQIFMDAFSSRDLVNWTKHPGILSKGNTSWFKRALWTPAAIRANNKYYFSLGANDIQNNSELGGIGVAVADNPVGPFKDALGKPLIDKIVNSAQSIDQFVFKDGDGQYYMYHGGWEHCNMVKMAPDLLSIVSSENDTIYREVTPQNHVEGPFMLRHNGKYYFMWSEDGWRDPDCSVAYAIANSPLGPFKRIGKTLQQDTNIATGAGHHSVVKGPGSDEWCIIYHRHLSGETVANSHATCIDRMYFNKDGKVEPVRMTFEGVRANPLTAPVRVKTYASPVINFSLPDPTIIKGDDEHYYLYAAENIKNVPIHRSRNLVNQYYVGIALTDVTRPNLEPKGRIWAPDISKIGDRYVAYYSMSVWGSERTCGIGIATADKLKGPFTNLGRLFRSNGVSIWSCIDPSCIEDNGKKRLFWGSLYGIYGTELADDGLSLKRDTPMEQITGTAYEGTYIHKQDSYYYLFASIGRCCEGLKSAYTTVVGCSKNLFSLYVDKRGHSMSDNHHEILVQKNKVFVGPGHNSELVTDKKGNGWVLYHAVSVASPGGRVSMMDRVR